MADQFDVDAAREKGIPEEKIQAFMKERGLVQKQKNESAATKVAQAVTTSVRGFRALGVGAQRLTEGTSPMDYATVMMNPRSALNIGTSAVKNAPKALERAAEATKPGFVPQDGEKIGAAVGEGLAVAGLTAGAPVGGTLLRQILAGGAMAGGQNALMQKAETGKINKDYAAYSAVFGGAIPLVPAGITAMSNIAKEEAPNFALKAIGYGKRFLKTDRMMAKAKESVDILMKEGVLGKFMNTSQIAENIKNAQTVNGTIINNALREATDNGGSVFEANKFLDVLDKLKPRSSNGKVLTGGHWDDSNAIIDRAKATIEAFGKDPQGVVHPLNAQEMSLIKQELQGAANFQAGSSQMAKDTVLGRIIAGKFREFSEDEMGRVADKIGNSALKREYIRAKKIYGAAMNAEDPIYNRLSSELGNKGISITDWIAISPAIALGSPQAALTFIAKKGIEKYGPVTAAVMAKGAAPRLRLAARYAGKQLPQAVIRSSSLGLREDR